MKRFIKIPPRWECPFCRHGWSVKPKSGDKCPCGAVVGARGWVFQPSK